MPRSGAEAKAREEIDRRLEAAGWILQHRDEVNPLAGPGVAVREFPLKGDFADYLLYVDGAAAGAIEAKPEGHTLTGVEVQSGKYSKLLPPALPAYRRPLPFLYESTGTETRFTNLMDPTFTTVSLRRYVRALVARDRARELCSCGCQSIAHQHER